MEDGEKAGEANGGGVGAGEHLGTVEGSGASRGKGSGWVFMRR